MYAYIYIYTYSVSKDGTWFCSWRGFLEKPEQIGNSILIESVSQKELKWK